MSKQNGPHDIEAIRLPDLISRHKWEGAKDDFAKLEDGRKIHYVLQGDGPPFIVLFPPGPGGTLENFHGKAFDAISKKAGVVYIDPAGVGMSSWAPREGGKYTPEKQCSDAIEVLDHLNIDRCVAYGWSFGGLIASEFAKRHPDRVSGIAVEAPALYGLPIDRLCGTSRFDEKKTKEELRAIQSLNEKSRDDLRMRPEVHTWMKHAKNFFDKPENTTVPLEKICKSNKEFNKKHEGAALPTEREEILLDMLRNYNRDERGGWKGQSTKDPTQDALAKERMTYTALHGARDKQYYSDMCDYLDDLRKNAPQQNGPPEDLLGDMLGGKSGKSVLFMEAYDDLTWGKERLENIQKAAKHLEKDGNFRLKVFPSNHDIHHALPEETAEAVEAFMLNLKNHSLDEKYGRYGRYASLKTQSPHGNLHQISNVNEPKDQSSPEKTETKRLPNPRF